MAVLKIQKFRILGLLCDEERILEAVQRSGKAEIKKTDGIDGYASMRAETGHSDDADKSAHVERAIRIIEDAKLERLNLAKAAKDKAVKKEKKPLFFARSEVSYTEFASVSTREIELFAAISDLEILNDRITSIKSEILKLKANAEKLAPYKDIDVPLSKIKDTKNTKAFLGLIPSQSVKDIKEKAKEIDVFLEIFPSAGETALAAFCKNEDYEKLSAILASAGLLPASFDNDKKAGDEIAEIGGRIEELNAEKIRTLDKIAQFTPRLSEFKLLYDYFHLKTAKKEVESGVMVSGKTFVLEGYVPAVYSGDLERRVKETNCGVIIEFEKPKKGDDIPTYVKNNKLVSNFEAVTNMFSSPRHDETDPNPIVSIFFMIFFGMMMGDFVYGLIMLLGGWFVLKKFRMEKGMRRIIAIITLSGIPTMIWGVLFGSYLAVDMSGGGWLADFLLTFKVLNPLKDFMILFYLSLGMGVVHILFGLGVNAFSLIRKGRFWDAVWDVFIRYVMFSGLGLLIFGMILEISLLTVIGMYIFIGALLVMMFTEGRNAKGFGKVTKGFLSVYGLTGYLSDILSYARLFGLLVSSAAMGYVFNLLANMLFSSALGMPFVIGMYIFGVIILIIGHTLSLALGLLGAYIHNCRLQFIEFFPKFYTGEGRLFKPYGAEFKYNIINYDLN